MMENVQERSYDPLGRFEYYNVAKNLHFVRIFRIN